MPAIPTWTSRGDVLVAPVTTPRLGCGNNGFGRGRRRWRAETDVRTVRAMAEGQDERVQEIRARVEAATTVGVVRALRRKGVQG